MQRIIVTADLREACVDLKAAILGLAGSLEALRPASKTNPGARRSMRVAMRNLHLAGEAGLGIRGAILGKAAFE